MISGLKYIYVSVILKYFNLMLNLKELVKQHFGLVEPTVATETAIDTCRLPRVLVIMR